MARSGPFSAFSGLVRCFPLFWPSLGVFSWRHSGVGRTRGECNHGRDSPLTHVRWTVGFFTTHCRCCRLDSDWQSERVQSSVAQAGSTGEAIIDRQFASDTKDLGTTIPARESGPSKSRDHSVGTDRAALPCRPPHRHCAATRELSMESRAIRLIGPMTFNDNDTILDDGTPVF